MGRPMVNKQDKRVVQVNIRLTIPENERVCVNAEASAMTPANWIRQKIFTGKFPQVKVSPLTAAMYRELHKIGVNLNQITKQMNEGKQPNFIGVIAELAKKQGEILKMLIHDSRPGEG
ncbi:plasmid mobilization protein [Mucilaginibacter aquaedulcis]|uniref:plasmid mobilization protein n=1 Tax=Mucilaginibacter aquaedulcis TaxID=1187081 RepID=UPI0025B3ED75|nr:plasmid mobilization relaxosome protein MobC [Mucilaginibacter aquaedulcis]MDN3551574.1 plasmid mobilization relaxosome protein MobC [Mucilaginibacter aquaedulcis]